LLIIVEKPERLSGTTLKRKHGEHALREVLSDLQMRD
jgi:hypothetical protein